MTTADVAEAYIHAGGATRDELIRENAALRRRLDAMRQERDAAQRANRQRSIWGVVVALWDVLTGRK